MNIGATIQHANLKSRERKQFVWPVAGFVVATLAATNPFYAPHITPLVGVAAWFSSMLLVFTLSGHPIGARMGVLLAGLFQAVPCFVWGTPLSRGLLMCFMALPFAIATALVLAPPIPGFRARVAYICNWCGKRQVKRRSGYLDAKAFLLLSMATAVFAVGIAVIKVVSAHGFGLPVRWIAGGIALFAFAEMATACHNFVTAALGISVPPFFQSPYRSASVGEFWTKRWNLPTSELFRTLFFAPLARQGLWLALSVTFMISAIAHALLAFMAMGRWKISIICGAFFLVQPLLIAVERRLAVRRWSPAAGRAWTFTVLMMVSPLFVEPVLQFVERSWGAPDNVLLPTAIVLGFVTVFCLFIAVASLASFTDEPEYQAV